MSEEQSHLHVVVYHPNPGEQSSNDWVVYRGTDAEQWLADNEWLYDPMDNGHLQVHDIQDYCYNCGSPGCPGCDGVHTPACTCADCVQRRKEEDEHSLFNDQPANQNDIAEVELVYRSKTKLSERQKITSSRDAYDLLMKAWDENKIELVEQFKIVLLDRANTCLGVSTVATGGITGCVCDARIVFATALKARASSIILAHNHPSGNLKPSEADKKLTEAFKKAGKVLEVSVLDHLIVTKEGYSSFADDGMLSPNLT